MYLVLIHLNSLFLDPTVVFHIDRRGLENIGETARTAILQPKYSKIQVNLRQFQPTSSARLTRSGPLLLK
jgi:hypothetical protein